MVKSDESAKKQLLLRLSPTLWSDITRWAEDDFRSINGQIEYILSQAVKKHKGILEIEDEENPLGALYASLEDE